MFPLYTVEQLEFIWTKYRVNGKPWKDELRRRKDLVKLIWGVCKGRGSLQIEAWTAARAALLLQRFYTTNPNCDGPGWAVAAAAILLACKIDGVNKSVQDVTKAQLYYRIHHDPKLKGKMWLLDERVEESRKRVAEEMQTLRNTEMELLFSLAFDLDVDVPYMELTRLFRTAGLLECVPAEHSRILGDNPRRSPSVAAAEPSSSVADSGTGAATPAPAAAENSAPSASNAGSQGANVPRGRLMQLALNFVKDSSETVAPLMFTARELAVAALYTSCNLVTAMEEFRNRITMAQALSLKDGTSFCKQYDISEERLNAVVNFIKTMYLPERAATMSTPSHVPGHQQAGAGSSSGGQSQQQPQPQEGEQGISSFEPSAGAGAETPVGTEAGAVAAAERADATAEAEEAVAAGQKQADGGQEEGDVMAEGGGMVSDPSGLVGREQVHGASQDGGKTGAEQEGQQAVVQEVEANGGRARISGVVAWDLAKGASEGLADGEALVMPEPAAETVADDELGRNLNGAAPKHLKRSRCCGDRTGNAEEFMNSTAADLDKPAAKRVAAGASVAVN